MSALSSFSKANLDNIRKLEVDIFKSNLQVQEEAYKAQLEHDYKMKMIKIEFVKKKRKELLERRKQLEDEISEIDGILDSL